MESNRRNKLCSISGTCFLSAAFLMTVTVFLVPDPALDANILIACIGLTCSAGACLLYLSRLDQVTINDKVRCPTCAYDLSRLPSDAEGCLRCPECGDRFALEYIRKFGTGGYSSPKN